MIGVVSLIIFTSLFMKKAAVIRLTTQLDPVGDFLIGEKEMNKEGMDPAGLCSGYCR
jgi:hypothetical protein